MSLDDRKLERRRIDFSSIFVLEPHPPVECILGKNLKWTRHGDQSINLFGAQIFRLPMSFKI